jgi:hypothetical protein
MEKTDKIKLATQHLNYDIKAEAVIADLLENGLESEDFVVIPNGTFKRRYSHDIAFTNKIKLNNGLELAGIHINRDGIYDTLPEGFFHQNTEHSGESKNISKESKRLKEEEKAARNFFLPFENEIFSQRIDLELEERKILNRFSENLSDDFSSEFWRLDQSLDPKYLSRMVKFLHISHKIAGNTKLTEKCLEVILDEHVTATIVKNCAPVKVNHKNVGEKQNQVLGSALLGVDFVCGNKFMSSGYTMQFNIGPLQNSSVTDYLKNGSISNFLKCFYGYFVPAELSVSTKILVSPEKLDFTLEPLGEGAVLGYNTAI